MRFIVQVVCQTMYGLSGSLREIAMVDRAVGGDWAVRGIGFFCGQ